MSQIPVFDEFDTEDEDPKQADTKLALPDFEDLISTTSLPDFDDDAEQLNGTSAQTFDPLGTAADGKHWGDLSLAPEFAGIPSGVPHHSLDVPALGRPAQKNPGAHLLRSDPYWENVWSHGSQAAWSTYEEVIGQAEARGLPIPAVVMQRKAAKDYVAHTHPKHRIMALLSILDSWGAVTAEQLVALTGSAMMLQVRDKAIISCFSAGLLSIGRLANSFERVTNAPHSAIYQGRNIRQRLRSVAGRSWTAAEYLQVDGGASGVRGAGRYDRHNILAVELALRAAETIPEVSMILGERWATTDAMFPHKARGLEDWPRRKHHMPGRGDGVIVLSNGMRIVLEVSTSKLPDDVMSEKVRRWAKYLTDNPVRESGLYVVFVTAPHPHRLTRSGHDPYYTSTKSGIRRALEDRYPRKDADSPAHRIGVISWTDWFPTRHTMTSDFYSLSADFLTGRRSLVEQDLVMDPTAAEAPMKFGPVLAATPHWMRRGDHTSAISLPSVHSGIGPLHDEYHLWGRGTAGRIKPPARLRLLTPNRPLRSAADWDSESWRVERGEDRQTDAVDEDQVTD